MANQEKCERCTVLIYIIEEIFFILEESLFDLRKIFLFLEPSITEKGWLKRAKCYLYKDFDLT